MGTNYLKEIDILSLSGAYGLRVCEQSDSRILKSPRKIVMPYLQQFM